jgi:hypothetical protein
MASFAVLIGSAGRASLEATKAECYRQMVAGDDDLIVVIDQHATGPLRNGYLGLRGFDAGYSWYGVPQINHAIAKRWHINRTHVLTLGDDDVYLSGALNVLRRCCDAHPDRVVLGRFISPAYDDCGPDWSRRKLLWDRPVLEIGNISGCCAAIPSQFVRPMPTERIKHHDFVWIQEAVQLSGQAPVWLDEVLVMARPPA